MVQAQPQQQAEITFTESLEVVSLAQTRSALAVALNSSLLRRLVRF